MHGSERRYENGVTGAGDGVADAQQFWLKLRRAMAYMPQLQALPWALAENGTREQQESSLQLHAEKKALVVLLACGEAKANVSINFNACLDCHEFFKFLSWLFACRIQLRQPKMIHNFAEGSCSCNDGWRWEARLA